jgi:hypothetical protein
VSSLSLAALAVLDQVRTNPVGRVQQMIKALIGLGAIIVLPAVAIWWARKRFRP